MHAEFLQMDINTYSELAMRLKMLWATKVKLTLFISKTMFHQPQDCDFYSLEVSQHKAGTLNR